MKEGLNYITDKKEVKKWAKYIGWDWKIKFYKESLKRDRNLQIFLEKSQIHLALDFKFRKLNLPIIPAELCDLISREIPIINSGAFIIYNDFTLSEIEKEKNQLITYYLQSVKTQDEKFMINLCDYFLNVMKKPLQLSMSISPDIYKNHISEELQIIISELLDLGFRFLFIIKNMELTCSLALFKDEMIKKHKFNYNGDVIKYDYYSGFKKFKKCRNLYKIKDEKLYECFNLYNSDLKDEKLYECINLYNSDLEEYEISEDYKGEICFNDNKKCFSCQAVYLEGLDSHEKTICQYKEKNERFSFDLFEVFLYC